MVAKQAVGFEAIQSVLALIYTAGLVYAAGAKYLLLTTLMYIPGTFLFFMARREQGEILFSYIEMIFFLVMLAGFGVAMFKLISGSMVI